MKSWRTQDITEPGWSHEKWPREVGASKSNQAANLKLRNFNNIQASIASGYNLDLR